MIEARVLTVGEATVSYRLHRSETASKARITVTPSAVDVVVPVTATDEQIDAVLRRRRGWLVAETRRMAERVAQTPALIRFVTGAKIPFRGRLCRLRVEPADGTLVEVTYKNGIVIGVPRHLDNGRADPLIESALRLWLKRRLRDDAKAFATRYQKSHGLRAKDVLIKDLARMWGACGRDGALSLDWHLVFAPKTVLEYAVVHELCHLRHRNHDDAFWKLVANVLPDWESRKDWLDRNEHLLAIRRIDAADEKR